MLLFGERQEAWISTRNDAYYVKSCPIPYRLKQREYRAFVIGRDCAIPLGDSNTLEGAKDLIRAEVQRLKDLYG